MTALYETDVTFSFAWQNKQKQDAQDGTEENRSTESGTTAVLTSSRGMDSLEPSDFRNRRKINKKKNTKRSRDDSQQSKLHKG